MATDTGALVVEEERRGSSELWGSECRPKGKLGGNSLPRVQMGTFCL